MGESAYQELTARIHDCGIHGSLVLSHRPFLNSLDLMILVFKACADISW